MNSGMNVVKKLVFQAKLDANNFVESSKLENANTILQTIDFACGCPVEMSKYENYEEMKEELFEQVIGVSILQYQGNMNKATSDEEKQVWDTLISYLSSLDSADVTKRVEIETPQGTKEV